MQYVLAIPTLLFPVRNIVRMESVDCNHAIKIHLNTYPLSFPRISMFYAAYPKHEVKV